MTVATEQAGNGNVDLTPRAATVVAADLSPAVGPGRSSQWWQDVMIQGVVRTAIEHFRGRLVPTAGVVVAAFDTPTRAIGFAQALLAETRVLRLRPRFGLHAGAIAIAGAEVGGPAVHLAVRTAQAAQPGEILVSRTVKDLTTGSDLAFEPVAGRDPADLPADWRLFRFTGHAAPAIAPPNPSRSEASWGGIRPALSQREREVAALVASGLSNRELAARLQISLPTAERHVTNILTKLGFRSRTQVATWVVD